MVNITVLQFTKMEKKLEKAQQHSEQQRNVIMQLKAQKCDVDLIKVHITSFLFTLAPSFSLNNFCCLHPIIKIIQTQKLLAPQ